MTFFCPNCWRENAADQAACEYCGHSIAEFNALPYGDKLLRSLTHPIAENRVMAVRILGELRYTPALPALEQMLDTEDDVYLLCEDSLAAAIGASEIESGQD